MSSRHASTSFLQAGALLAVLIGSTAGAATFTVTNSNDDGSGSLRQAIIDAEANRGVDTITFNVSGPITINLITPPNSSASPLGIFHPNLTIDGGTQSVTLSGVSGLEKRLMEINNGAKLTLNHLTVTKGNADIGGGILINSGGTLTVTNSTFTGNSASWHGGCIYNWGGTLTVTNSTFSGNSATFGGCISNSGGTLTVTNSTFANNNAGYEGKDIYSRGTLNLANTISINCAAYGYLYPSGINLVQGGTCLNYNDGSFITTDPMLDPLANNGGPTQTIALLPGSPAIDTANDTICAALPVNNLDQRGVTRPQGAHCDIGAFELGSENQPPIANAGLNQIITSENQSFTVIQGTATDPENDPLTYRWLEGQTEGQTVLLGSTPVGTNGVANLVLSNLPLAVGEHTLTLEVSDGKAPPATDEMILTIGNSAPTAAPTGGGTYSYGDSITFGGKVSDYDNDLLTYGWSVSTACNGMVQATPGSSPNTILPLLPCVIPSSLLGLGTHKVTLTVNDGVNDPVSNTVDVEVTDTTAPTLAPEPDKSILWPPNHKMVDISINANASDNGGPVTLSAAVTSNEPQNGLGDGDIAPDWTTPVINQQTGIITLQLRAERSGSGDGRVYTVTITATDSSGNVSTASVEILVPHDKGK